MFVFSFLVQQARGAKVKAGVGGAGAGKGGKALVKPVLTVETDAKKVREKKNKFYCYRIIRSSLISDIHRRFFQHLLFTSNKKCFNERNFFLSIFTFFISDESRVSFISLGVNCAIHL